MDFLASYTVIPPTGEPFRAVILNDGQFTVRSNRKGVWERDPHITTADLLCPEQDLNEWDIVRDETASSVKPVAIAP
jgi:hypothetical protein